MSKPSKQRAGEAASRATGGLAARATSRATGGLSASAEPSSRHTRAATGFRFVAAAILIVLACTRMLLTESLAPPWTIMSFAASPATASQPDSEAAANEAAAWGGPTPASSMGMFAWILLAGLLWAVAQAISPRPIVGGLALAMIAVFAAGAIISTCLASNKAAARNCSVQFLGYLVSFWLLLQLLATARWRQVAVVAVVAAGVCFAGYGIYQHFVENPDFIANKWPVEREKWLAAEHLQPDDPRARMMDERVRSAEVKSFAINANSAAALLIVATLAAAGWAVRKWRSPRAPLRRFFATAATVAAGLILVMLLLTRSRGGISGGMLALALFVGLAIARRWACAHWKGLAIAAAGIVVAASAGVIVACAAMKQPGPDSFWYRNNGAMSMLYRWQYWEATAGVVADHPWGVGGGNFGNAYLAHKLPAALEDVDDPHNFVLAALAQYGLLGALGLLGLIGWVFWRLVKPTSPGGTSSGRPFSPPPLGEDRGEGISKRQPGAAVLRSEKTQPRAAVLRSEKTQPRAAVLHDGANRTPLSLPLVALGIGLLLAVVRTLIQWPNYGDLPANLAIAVLGPVIVLVLLLDRDELSWSVGGGEEWVRLAIGCGLVGFLLACTIDFGMSQAAPATAFWTLAAIAVAGKVWEDRGEIAHQTAIDDRNKTTALNGKPDAASAGGEPLLDRILGRIPWVVVAGGFTVLLGVLLRWVYFPVAESEFEMRQLANGQFRWNYDESGEEFLMGYRNDGRDSWDPAFWEGFADWELSHGVSMSHDEIFSRAHKLDPGNPQYLLRLGEAFLADAWIKHNRTEGTRCLLEATRLAPNSRPVWEQAGRVFLKAKMYRQGADCLAHAIQIDDTIRRYDVKRLFALSARARRELETLLKQAQADLQSTTQPSL